MFHHLKFARPCRARHSSVVSGPAYEAVAASTSDSAKEYVLYPLLSLKNPAALSEGGRVLIGESKVQLVAR